MKTKINNKEVTTRYDVGCSVKVLLKVHSSVFNISIERALPWKATSVRINFHVRNLL